MQKYEKLSDNEDVGTAAKNMVAQARQSRDSVKAEYGKDTIVVKINDDFPVVTISVTRIVSLDESVEFLEATLETSAGKQQEEEGL